MISNIYNFYISQFPLAFFFIELILGNVDDRVEP